MPGCVQYKQDGVEGCHDGRSASKDDVVGAVSARECSAVPGVH